MAKPKQQKTFPKMVFVKWKIAGAESWLTVEADPGTHLESVGQSASLGVYQLVGSATVSSKATCDIHFDKKLAK